MPEEHAWREFHRRPRRGIAEAAWVGCARALEAEAER